MKVEWLSGFSFISFFLFWFGSREGVPVGSGDTWCCLQAVAKWKGATWKEVLFHTPYLHYSTSAFSEKRSDGEMVPKLQSKSLDCVQALNAEGQVKTALRGASRWRAFSEVSLKVSEDTQVFLFVYILFSWTEIDFWKLCCRGKHNP